jgi:hypothetical protein
MNPTADHHNLPIPVGATADEWSGPHFGLLSKFDDAVWVRFITWSKHDAEKIGVGVDGCQYSNGQIERGINLYEADTMTAAEARALARQLIAAADSLDDIEAADYVHSQLGR